MPEGFDFRTHQQVDAAGEEVCLKFTKGKCTRGDRCMFSHAPVAQVIPRKEALPDKKDIVPNDCIQFAKGSC